MKTLTADKYLRVRIPTAKPNQKFAFEDHGNGIITLKVLQVAPKERPFDAHLYDDLVGERLLEQQALEAASARVDLSAEERDRE